MGHKTYFNNGTGRATCTLSSMGVDYDSDLIDFDSDVSETVKDLKDHLCMDSIHKREIAEFISENEEVIGKGGILLAAGSVPLMQMGQIEYQEFRAYKIGEAVVVEEKEGDSWQKVINVPYRVCILIAHARSQRRSTTLRKEHPELRKELQEDIESTLDLLDL